ncbi:MAG: hypothetical protein ACKER6_01065 [Candidatus Hodgkinia cicadicola]
MFSAFGESKAEVVNTKRTWRPHHVWDANELLVWGANTALLNAENRSMRHTSHDRSINVDVPWKHVIGKDHCACWDPTQSLDNFGTSAMAWTSFDKCGHLSTSR